MQNISDDTKTKIRNKIAEIERQTNSELVCIITRKSARYVFFPLIMAALIALFLPALEIAGHIFGYHEKVLTFQHQTIAFVVLALLFLFTPLNCFLTPRWIRHQNCNRYCTEQFFVHGLHETENRSAILFFVSWDEKFVRIIADKGINEKIDQDVWIDLVKDFIVKVKAKEIEAGFLNSIEKAGALLIKNFPAHAASNDEISNHLIILARPEYVS